MTTIGRGLPHLPRLLDLGHEDFDEPHRPVDSDKYVFLIHTARTYAPEADEVELKDIPCGEPLQAKTETCISEDPRLVIREVG